ncbi:class I SAM-dependent methyltransferase [Pedobacter sp. SJ11]|uniref:Class I SAM-dependent methyltransferase n=1 Tax=Pedobacter rhodius TaxID=3004098 RepID=A0ABT4KXT6_9SPHI|nr:class I SAM-dependent methyltransferase [Pedobacter sp. SJ11]MCZ4223649.1 class I SAM-dependent methyltransferase [Pedobacter sp. SJ11]
MADYYDSLSRLVFAKSQVNAQINQLSHIPENSLILIVGGGTGWILEEISKIYTSGLKIIYVEVSAKMIALSKHRKTGKNQIEFISTGIEDFKTAELFDVILTPFLFDNFIEVRAEIVFRKLNLLLNTNGLWFLVDFSLDDKKGKWWKWVLLKSMYIFFKIIGIVEANDLVDMKPYFLAEKYQILEEKFYYGSFIKASILKKNENR